VNLVKKHNKLFHALVILLTVAVNLAFFTDYARSVNELSFVREWGSYDIAAPASFLQIATSSNGKIFVTDAENHRVAMFDSTGSQLGEFGSEGTGDGNFKYPWGIAADASGNMYIADSQNHRIQYFNNSGIYIGKFGTFGSGKGELQFPRGVAVSSSGVVYVADSGNHRISMFDLSGAYIGKFGSQGSGLGEFSFPEDVSVAGDNKVYVSDTGNNKIKVFSADGTYLSEFGMAGSGNGQFSFPKGISVGAGSVFIADTGNSRLQAFTTTGTYQAKFGTQGTGNGEFDSAQDIAVLANNQVLVADGGNRRIQIFTKTGTFVSSFPFENAVENTDGKFNFPSGIFKAASGKIYVADTQNNRVQVFSETGVYISQFGIYGSGKGQFISPVDVGVADDGSVFVVDQENDRVEVFDENNNYLWKFGKEGSGAGEFSRPSAIVVKNSSLYVADTQNNRIQVFDMSGNYITEYPAGSAPGLEFLFPTDIDVDSKGNIYIADTGNNRIQQLDPGGNFVQEFAVFTRNSDPNAEPADGSFYGISGIAVDDDGHIFVSDTRNNRVQVINTDGSFVSKVGHQGTQESEFTLPRGIAIGANHQVYVADSYNHRVQEFKFAEFPPVDPVDPVVPPSSGGGGGGGGVNVDPIVPDPVVVDPAVVNPPVDVVVEEPEIIWPILPEPVRNAITAVVDSVSENIIVPTQIAVAKIEEATPVALKTYVPRTIMTSGLLVGSIAMITDNLFAAPYTMAQFMLFPARLWANLLTAFGIRKRRRPWGAVYDTMTKQPLDPVYLELVNKDGFVVARTSTDIYGRYSFKVTPGHYMLRPRKTGYVFPSLVLAHTDRDEVYKDLYFGNYFEIEHQSEMMNKNIPMDRQKIDWKEFMNQDQKILTWLARRDQLISQASHILFIIGFAVAIIALLLAPRVYTIIVFLLYVFMYALRRSGPNPSKLGRVIDQATKAPLSFAIVRVFSVKLGNEVVRKATNKFGQFFCPVPDGDYYLSFDRKNQNGTYTEANKKELVHITRGVVSGKWEASF